MKPRKRKPGRPRGTTRGGSHVVSIRVNDAQHAKTMNNIEMPQVGDIITYESKSGDVLGAKVLSFHSRRFGSVSSGSAHVELSPGGVRITEEASGIVMSITPHDWIDRVLSGKIKLVRRGRPGGVRVGDDCRVHQAP